MALRVAGRTDMLKLPLSAVDIRAYDVTQTTRDTAQEATLMSLVLDLPPELERQLAAEAAKLQLPVGEYALRVLAAGCIPEPTPRTGAELVAYWQSEGLIGTRPDVTDPSKHARALRQQAEKRERA
jgi:hypothetical protein